MISFHEFVNLLEGKKPKCEKCGKTMNTIVDLYHNKTFWCPKCKQEMPQKNKKKSKTLGDLLGF